MSDPLPEKLEEECFGLWFATAPLERSGVLGALRDAHPDHAEAIDRLTASLEHSETLLGPVQDGADLVNAPSKIGGYEIVGELGSGGFGTVYEALQLEPVRRTVAVKLLPSWVGVRGLQRFAAERQTLARMHHPNVAQILDAGTTDDGRMFFAMELVRGAPLIAHCERRQLSIEKRLHLLLEVCAGVQHAHQREIVHRDLKPSNVLVTEVDGVDRPKIIDFGIAKLLDEEGAEVELTMDGGFIGTPLYASPEQAAGEAVDTRTDVHALGLLLYELLTGTLPYSAEELDTTSIGKALQLVRDTDPQPPSKKLKTLGDKMSKVALQRNTTPQRLLRSVRGDLDGIALHALDRRVERRYESAGAFADDLRRCLNNEPVAARKLTFAYSVSKFTRRHRLAVAIAGVLMLSLLVAASAVIWSLFNVREARDEAIVARRSAEWESYTASLAAANASILRGNVADARERLEATVSALRGWEYDLITSNLDSARFALELPSEPRGVVVTDRGLLAVGTAAGTVDLWDLEQRIQVGSIPLHGSPVFRVLSMDGGRRAVVASGNPAGAVEVVDFEEQRVVGRLAEYDVFHALTLSKDGHQFALSANNPPLQTGTTTVGAGEPRRGSTKRILLSMEFTPDGENLIVGTYRGFIGTMNFDGQEVGESLTRDGNIPLRDRNVPMRDRVSALLFSPQRNLLVSGGTSGRVLVWDWQTRKLLRAMQTSGYVRQLLIDEASGVLYAVGGSILPACTAFDVESGDSLGQFNGHRQRINGIAMLPNQRMATCSAEHAVRVWDRLPRSQYFIRPMGLDCRKIAADPQRTRIATCSIDAHVYVWNMEPFRLEMDLELLVKRMGGECVALHGNRAYVVGWDNSLRVIDIERAEVTGSTVLWDGEERCQSLIVSPTGDRVVATTGEAKMICFDTQTLNRMWEIKVPRHAHPTEFSPSGLHVAFGSSQGDIFLLDSMTGEERARAKYEHGITDLAWSPDGTHLVASVGDDGVLLDSLTLQQTRRLFSSRGGAGAIVHRPDGQMIATLNRGQLRLYDTKTGLQRVAMDSEAGDLLFSADGSRLFGFWTEWGRRSYWHIWDADGLEEGG